VWILARERQGRRREERDSYIQRMAERMADWLVLCMALAAAAAYGAGESSSSVLDDDDLVLYSFENIESIN